MIIPPSTRRHLTAPQLACVATDSLPYFEEDAAKRKKALSGTRSNPGEVKEKIPEPANQSRDQAAQAVSVSARYVSDAKKIKEASPETFEKLKSERTHFTPTGNIVVMGAW